MSKDMALVASVEGTEVSHQHPSPRHFLTLLYSSFHTCTEVNLKANLASLSPIVYVDILKILLLRY